MSRKTEKAKRRMRKHGWAQQPSARPRRGRPVLEVTVEMSPAFIEAAEAWLVHDRSTLECAAKSRRLATKGRGRVELAKMLAAHELATPTPVVIATPTLATPEETAMVEKVRTQEQTARERQDMRDARRARRKAKAAVALKQLHELTTKGAAGEPVRDYKGEAFAKSFGIEETAFLDPKKVRQKLRRLAKRRAERNPPVTHMEN